jgi:hypothetical protein
MKRVTVLILLVLCAYCFMGCATTIRGQQQYVPINSDPVGAQVKINGASKGYTPVVVPISRRDVPIVTIESDGYKTYEIALNRTRAPWGMLNLLFGPFAWFGLIPDLIMDANVTFEPETIDIKLVKIQTKLLSPKETPDNLETLKKLKELKDLGIITETEYEAKRKAIVERIQ